MAADFDPCPECGYAITGISSGNPDLPDEIYSGLPVICVQCGHLRIADEEGNLRLPDDLEKQVLDEDPGIMEARQKIAAYREYLAYCNEKFQGMQSPYSLAHFRRSREQAAQEPPPQ